MTEKDGTIMKQSWCMLHGKWAHSPFDEAQSRRAPLQEPKSANKFAPTIPLRLLSKEEQANAFLLEKTHRVPVQLMQAEVGLTVDRSRP